MMCARFYLFRFFRYYKRNGLLNTIHRTGQKIYQRALQNGEIIFYSDLTELTKEDFKLPEGFAVVAVEKEDETYEVDLMRMMEYIGIEQAKYQFKERFSRSAILWLVKQESDVAGYIWCSKKSSIEPYFFPLAENDALLFDGAVLPEYRGRNIYPIFLTKIFYELKKGKVARVFIDAHKWNKPALRSLEKIPVKRFCAGNKIHLFGRTIVLWDYTNAG